MPLILVVDDDDAVRSVLEEGLADAGFHVITASDGRDAIEKYRRHRPALVITDVLMPRLSGIDLVTRLLAEDRYAKIIVMSGVVGEPFLEASRSLGVRRIYTKPVSVVTLVAAARELTTEVWQGDR
jgi:CheY-like chemotaxis protein